jgi:hypothetical protein
LFFQKEDELKSVNLALRKKQVEIESRRGKIEKLRARKTELK